MRRGVGGAHGLSMVSAPAAKYRVFHIPCEELHHRSDIDINGGGQGHEAFFRALVDDRGAAGGRRHDVGVQLPHERRQGGGRREKPVLQTEGVKISGQPGMGDVTSGPREGKIALKGVGNTIEQAGGKGIKACLLFLECAMQGMRLFPGVLCCGGRQTRITRQALSHLEVVCNGLDICGVGLVIALTDELEGVVVSQPGSDATFQGRRSRGIGTGADVRKKYLDAGDSRHRLTHPVGAMYISFLYYGELQQMLPT